MIDKLCLISGITQKNEVFLKKSDFCKYQESEWYESSI